MKFFAALLGAALLALTTAAPDQNASNIFVFEVKDRHEMKINLGLLDDYPITPFVTRATQTTKRDFITGTFVVDIWQNRSRSGRYEGLITEPLRCYNLGNGWNDAINSLSVPRRSGCIFHRDKNCDIKDTTLTVAGEKYIADLRQYGFHSKISSYWCFQ